MSLTPVGAFISRLPFVSSFLKWFKEKRRLAVEYLLLASFIAFAGLSLALWLTRKEVKKELAETTSELVAVKGRLTTVEFAKQQQDQTIEKLRQLRESDNQALNGLLTELDGLSSKNNDIRKKIRDLENSNEAVRNLRQQPVPHELGCLLEPRACEAGSAARPRR